MLLVVFMGLLSCGRGSYILVVVCSSLFFSGGTYQFGVGARGSSKRGSRSCRDEAGCFSQVSVGGFLSSCGQGLLSTCGMGVSFKLWCGGELLMSIIGGPSLVVVREYL